MFLSLLLLLAQEAPPRYDRVEEAARRAVEILGVRARPVRVEYEYAPAEEAYGEYDGRRIWINTHPRDRGTLFHEFWHHYQQEAYGGERAFDRAYGRFPNYASNRFEHEAELVEGKLERLYWRSGGGRRFERALPGKMREMLPELRELWDGSKVPPRHLDHLEARLEGRRVRSGGPAGGNVAAQKIGAVARDQAQGMLMFAAAYLLKEGLKAIETGEPQRAGEAAKQLAEPRFWTSTLVFSGTAQMTQIALSSAPSLLRSAAPLAAGMIAVQVLSGRTAWQDALLSTAVFLATGLAVDLVADMFIAPLLFAAGPPGWLAFAAFKVAKMAVTLYLGEKLEGWLRGFFRPRTHPMDGIQQRVELLTESAP